MRAAQLRAYDGKPESISVVEMPVSRPRRGEVLVRVFASPINPSDLVFIRGLYGFKKPLPTTQGILVGRLAALQNFPGTAASCAPDPRTAAKRSQDQFSGHSSLARSRPCFAAVRR